MRQLQNGKMNKFTFTGYVARQPVVEKILKEFPDKKGVIYLTRHYEGDRHPENVNDYGLVVEEHHDYILLPPDSFPDLKKYRKCKVTVEY